MSQELTIWCERLKKEVTEGMPAARRIRLMTAGEGTVWQQWEPVADLDAAAWASEAEALISSLKLELPKRRVQLVFVAEDHAGATIQNKPRTVTGENASAQDLGTQNGAKALADAMTSVGRLMETTLEQARKMLDWQAHRMDAMGGELHDAHEILMAIKKVELEGEQQESAASKIMMEQVQQATPMLMQVLQHWATSPSKSTLGSTVAAAANAAVNGAKAS